MNTYRHRHRYPLQIESAECGLVCVAIASAMLGAELDLGPLRRRYLVSSRGQSLSDIGEIANDHQMSARAVRCELGELKNLTTPAILHWDLNHFVVLRDVRGSRATIVDPAVGETTLSLAELGRHFTGVALELTRTSTFKRRREKSPLRLLSLLQWNRAMTSTLIYAAVLSLLLQAYVLASPLYMQIVIDEVVVKGDHKMLTTLAVGFAMFATFNAIADFMRGVAVQKLSALLSWDMSVRLFHHMIRLPVSWFQRRRLADVITRFDALESVKQLISGGLITAVIDGGLSIATLIMMFIFSPPMAAVVVVFAVVYLICRVVSTYPAIRFGAENLAATIGEQGKRIETIRAIQSIKLASGEARRESDWANKLAGSVVASQKAGIVSNATAMIQRLIDALSLVTIVYFGARNVIDGKNTVGLLYAFMAYRAQFMARSASLFEQAMAWRMLDIYTQRLADITLNPIEVGIDQVNTSLPPIVGGISLDNVAFRYSPSDPDVLKNVSFKIAAGEFVAIVGASGCGKSTLVKLISGLYLPTFGVVSIDGTPMSSWGPRCVRRVLGTVMQDDELMAGTIAENVAFFDRAVDMDRVDDALRQASMYDEVQQLPMRAETYVGDMGSALSGGQKQRILLARALYRKPTILLLDEATSHLDVQRERSINESLRELSMTRIIIAHRPETIAAADRVLVLQGGSIVLDRRRDDSPVTPVVPPEGDQQAQGVRPDVAVAPV